MKGINPTPSGGSSNSFSTIIVSDYFDNAAGNAEGTTMSFSGCNISAEKLYADANVTQALFDLRSPYSNTVIIDDCNLVSEPSSMFIQNAIDSTYCKDLETRRENMVFTNKVIADGVDITYTDSRVGNYIDADISSELDLAKEQYPYNPIPFLYELQEGESEESIVRNINGTDYTINAIKSGTDEKPIWSLEYK